jgi:3-oxoadipate enol-lactonase
VRIAIDDDLQLNYSEAGNGDVFVLASPPGSDMGGHTAHYVDVFSPHFRTITYDSRGAGQSDRSDWYSYRSSCDDLAKLLTALGVDRAIVYGGSGGGILALHFVLNYPNRVRGIVVDGTSAEVNLNAAKNWRKMAEETLKAGRDVSTEISAPGAFEGNEFKVRRSHEPDPTNDPRALFAFFYGISDLYENPVSPKLAQVTAPMLILVGEQDKLAGVGGSVRMHRAAPTSTLRILPECGHTVLGTRPEIAAQEILEFAGGLAPSVV